MSNATVCPAVMMSISKWYATKHGYFALVICFFGIISNMLSIIILLRKNMMNQFNYFLVGVAVADNITMFVYVPYAAYFNIKRSVMNPNFPYNWLVYLIIWNTQILTFHTIALWLTVSLAVFRYIVVCHHVHGPRLCSLRRAKITTLIVFIASIIVCIPNYFNLTIAENNNINATDRYSIDLTTIAKAHNRLWFKFTIWLYVVFLKVGPCMGLLVLSALLIRTMTIAKRRRERLLANRNRAEVDSSNEHNRTTTMLVVVVVTFALADLPQGIIAFWSMLSNYAFECYYSLLGDIFDFIVLVNSAVNFIFYCIMSHQFRLTFKEVFLQCCYKSSRKQRTKNSINGTDYTVITNETTAV